MGTGRYLFTSESVTEGHPDKLADRISDAVLDAYLEQDSMARVACETSVTTGLVLLFGEISSKAQVNAARVARDTITEVGYTSTEFGFDAEHSAVLVSLDQQSPDIAQGVNRALEIRHGKDHDGYLDSVGAGDQGMVFGFASDETPEYLPTPIALAHRLSRRLAEVRKTGVIPYLRPDGKSQVTVTYEGERPVRVDTIVISAQHSPDVTLEQIREEIITLVIRPGVPEGFLDDRTRIFVNPTGRFVVGGPHGDAGLTGRKIIVDTYGGFARHGGGARPVSILAESFCTSKLTNSELVELIAGHFDLRPAAIIERLDLRRPIYRQTAAYGHFGRTDLDLPWERTDKAVELHQAVFRKSA
ncbi:MAG: methionine adenosyltransferase [Geobacteraceae bacterium]|jgi:S-adenosylmethionine synthetase